MFCFPPIFQVASANGRVRNSLLAGIHVAVLHGSSKRMLYCRVAFKKQTWNLGFETLMSYASHVISAIVDETLHRSDAAFP